MRLSTLIAGRTVLGLTTAGFLLTLGVSFINLRKYEEISRIELSDTTWLVAQTRYEVLRFTSTLESFVQPTSAVSEEDLAHRLDALWSRLPLFLEGPESVRYAAIPGLRNAVRRMQEMLRDIDEGLAELRKGDFESYGRILATFQERAKPLDELIVSALVSDEGRALFYNKKLADIHVTLMIAFFGVLGSGTGLIVLLLKQNAAARRAEQEAQENGARLRVAIGSIADGFVLYGARDQIVLCNEKFIELNQPAAAAIQPGASFEAVQQALVESCAVAGAVGDPDGWIAERRRRHLDAAGPFEVEMAGGRWLRVNEQKTPDGGIVGILTDITDSKRREDALREAKEEADRASRAKSTFLANMSHELRTPLNAIIGFSEMMAEQVLGPIGNSHYADYVNDIRNSGRHLLGIINDILDMAKIESGNLDMSAEDFSLDGVIRDVVKLLRPRFQDGAIDPTFESPGDTVIHGDPKLFRQVLLNLYSNALKFTGAGGRIHTSVAGSADKGLVLRISDTGIGIAQSDLQRVLQPFVQVENHLQRRYDGTGLGLPLVKAMVGLHDGHFELESSLGIGTTAVVTLPAHRVSFRPPVTGILPAPVRPAVPPRKPAMTVMPPVGTERSPSPWAGDLPPEACLVRARAGARAEGG